MAEFFVNIKTIVQKVIDGIPNKPLLKNVDTKKGDNIFYVLDTSGSTGAEYSRNITILQKSKDIICSDILKNKLGHNYLSNFNTSYNRKKNYHGEILVEPEIDFVMLPDGLISDGATFTADPLQDIVKLTNEKLIHPLDEVMIYTDGETNSNRNDLINVVKDLKNRNIRVGITAISLSNKDLNKISINEGNNLVGMDLLLFLENDIYSYKVYNKIHVHTPFLGAINSDVNKKQLSFFDIDLPKGISMHMFIWEMIDNLNDQINWGNNDFVRFCAEIGKIISVFNITLSSIDNYLIKVSTEIKRKSGSGFEVSKIKKVIIYGFNCSRNKKPMILSSANDRIELDIVEKRNQFGNAVETLKTKGTTLGCDVRIAFDDNYVIIDNNTIPLKHSLGTYPKSMTENNKFVFFGLNENEESPEYEQALRIGLREHCSKLGYPNAIQSASVIFHVLNIMSMMYLKGSSFNIFMEHLRKLAIIQTKMNRMIAPKTYGLSFYALWKNGELPSVHFSRKESHSSLFKDVMINPLKLEEPIWWALMMTMLGLFDEQLPIYQSALSALGIENNKQAFLQYVKKTYSGRIRDKKMFLEGFEKEKESLITLEPFPQNVEVLSVKDHGQCKANLWFTREELEGIKKICVYCKAQLTEQDFCVVVRDNNGKKFEELCKKI